MRHLFLLSAVALASLVGPAMAGQNAPAQSFAGGVLVKVDEAARTIDVRQGEHEATYALAQDVQVLRDKQPLEVSGLSAVVGHQLTIRYTADGEKREASRVTVLGLRKPSTR